MKPPEGKITGRAIGWGAFFAGLFAALTVFLINRRGMFPTASQIPLFPYALLILSVLVVNPVCRLVRFVREFSRTELLMIFVMGLVSSGLSSFGLTAQLLPVMGSLFNRQWNNEQTEWHRHVEPFLNEYFFVSEPGIRQVAIRCREASAGADSSAAEEARQNLRALEEKAFAKVDLFRRGLPAGLRAFPGFFPVAQEDDAGSYFARMNRLFCGSRAAGHLREIIRILETSASNEFPPDAQAQVLRAGESAATALAPVVREIESLTVRRGELDAVHERLAQEKYRIENDLASLRHQSRQSDTESARRLSGEADRLFESLESLNKEYVRTGGERERIAGRLQAAERVQESARAIRALPETLAGLRRAGQKASVEEILETFPSFDGTWNRYLFGDIPWSHWGKPFLAWGFLIGFTFLTLMTFNILIFRQWAHHEKLVYPLAELPETLAGLDEAEDARGSSLFRSGLFWAGVSISASILGWNLLCATGVLPGLSPLDLANNWTPYVDKTNLAGLTGIRAPLVFTMIGLAFLIPRHVSFSLWFFWVLAIVQLLVLVWLGFGVNEKSFPSEWWYTLNFRTAQGGGALLVFASVTLFKCRKYLICVFFPGSLHGLEEEEQRELRVSSLLFLLGSLGVVIMLWRGLGAHWFYAVVLHVFMLIITIGLVRAVAEGGILAYKTYVGPFHIIRHVFGLDREWTSPSLMAPLMVFYSILFLDLKCFIAPAMANGLKIRSDLNMKRSRFYAGMALCIVVAVVVSMLTALMLSYSYGADAMRSWFFSSFPRGLFSRIAEMSKAPPAVTPGEHLWLGFGALVMAMLLFFRRRILWLPHPIGLIMWVNPVMATYWFSIFIGWLAKRLVTKYGNKATYRHVRGVFVGLIVGELLVVMLAMIVSLVMNRDMGIDLNVG